MRRSCFRCISSPSQEIASSKRISASMGGLSCRVIDWVSLIAELNEHLSSAIRDTQSITRQLSPPMLADMRFEDAISWLGDEMQRKHDLLIYVEKDDKQKPLSNELRLFLFHAVRELVTNIVKHSSAKSVEISLKRIRDSIQIEVSDD